VPEAGGGEVIKRAPTPLRLAAIALFALTCFGCLLYLWLAFGGPAPLKPKGYRAYVRFPEATQLATQADVRIAGVNVGKVVRVEAAKTGNRTVATLEVQTRYAPIPRDTHAILRLKSLLGETYVELSPGNRRAGVLPDGGTLPDAAVSKTVELDEIMRTFKPDTRAAFRTWQQATALAMHGRGDDINAAFGNLPGFADSSDKLLQTLDSQSAAVRRTISGTGQFFAAISARQGELSGLVRDSNQVFRATAQRNQDFANVFRELPRFERESRLTLPALTQFGKRSDPVVRQLQPVADQMAPVFASTQRLAPEFNAFFKRLGPVVTASERGLPAFKTILTQLPPLLDDFQPWLRNANPMIQYLGAHKREITAFFANVTAASVSRDIDDGTGTRLGGASEVHYLRTAQTLNPQSLSYDPRPLGSARANAYQAPGAFTQIPTGLPVLDPRTCSNGDPAPPDSSDPPALAPLVQQYAFRTDGRDVARPPCKGQGNYPGFSTSFPQLRAEP
jgi:phospholipid/cholesterol/gamma-HCH transport system substrate-binding protein